MRNAGGASGASGAGSGISSGPSTSGALELASVTPLLASGSARKQLPPVPPPPPPPPPSSLSPKAAANAASASAGAVTAITDADAVGLSSSYHRRVRDDSVIVEAPNAHALSSIVKPQTVAANKRGPAATVAVVAEEDDDTFNANNGLRQRGSVSGAADGARRSSVSRAAKEADSNRALIHEMCDVCDQRKARVECRDTQCVDVFKRRLYCLECNQHAHTAALKSDQHARVEYFPRHKDDLARLPTEKSNAVVEENALERAETHTSTSHLLKLSTRRAIFDNPVMRAWRRMSCWTRCGFRIFTACRDCFSHRRNTLPFWSSTIRSIEATRGSSVAAWFWFAKWVFMLNLLLAAMFCTLIVPSLFAGSYHIAEWNDLVGLAVGAGLEKTFFFYGARLLHDSVNEICIFVQS